MTKLLVVPLAFALCASSALAESRSAHLLGDAPKLLLGASPRLLDAALGASRDVVDRGWLSYPHQIGLSGKTVTPRLYVGLGVSGSIQHLAGMQTAETIVAVNSDPDAQIFHVADVGIVGNLFDVVPVLVKKIQAARSAT